MLRPVLIAIAFFFACPPIFAQSIVDTTHGPFRADSAYLVQYGIPNGTKLSFDHLLSIYEWTGHFNYTTRESPFAAVAKDHTIDTVQLLGDSRFLEDDRLTTTSANGYFYANQPLDNSPLSALVAFYGSSYVTSGLSNLSLASSIPKQTEGFGVAGFRYLPPGSGLDFSAAGGFAQAGQAAVNAEGTIFRGTLNAPFEPIAENAFLAASALADERFFKERGERYSNDLLSLSTASSIGAPNLLDSNHAYLNAGLQRRDFFFTTDSASPPVKQERTDLSLTVLDSLSYPLATDLLTGTISAAFAPQSITRTSDIAVSTLASNSFSAISTLLVPNQISILGLDIGGRLDYAPATSWSAQGRMSYEEHTETVRLVSNQIAGLDPSLVTKYSDILDESSFSTRTTSAGGTVRYIPNVRDTFQTEINAHLLNYDTPSALNDDDHDELITSAAFQYGHTFSSALNGGVAINAARTHLVYLMSDRSAQNNVIQSLALSSHASYESAALLALVIGQVYANYTVLDFLNSIPIAEGTGNYLLRGVSIFDSINVPTGLIPFSNTSPLSIEEGVTLQLSERGSYDVPSFSEVLNTRIFEVSASLLFGLSSQVAQAPWSVRAGVRGFLLNREGPQFLELERQTRIGPVVTITLLRPMGIGPMLAGSIWYSVVRDQTFDVPSLTRTPELESHLSAQWTF